MTNSNAPSNTPDQETRFGSLPSLLQEGRDSLGFSSLLLALIVIFYYYPALGNNFVNWDDIDNITGNVHIRQLDWNSIGWMLTNSDTGNWMPLTWLTFALNYQWGGLDPRIFHATNIFFHALNTILVFLVSVRLLRLFPEPALPGPPNRPKTFAMPIAFLTALLFGLHPIHVESVAWATERKDVLYGFFYLFALGLYLGKPNQLDWKGPKPWVLLGFYCLALLSKPMAITLPLVFLILDFFPLNRWSLGFPNLIKEKIPFFLLALASAWVTLATHEKDLSYARIGVEFYWLMNSFRSVLFYLIKMAWPSGLTAFYPFPPDLLGFYLFENYCAAALVVLISYLLFRHRHKAPYLLAAWLYYLVTLLPVAGLIQTGSAAAADRYTYLPSLGFFLPLSAMLAFLMAYRWGFFGIAVLLATLGMGQATLSQIDTWKDSKSLWSRVTSVYPDENPDNYSKLGAEYIKARRYEEALEAYSRAASIPPPLAVSFNGLGTALLYLNRLPDAKAEFEYSLKLDPKFTAPRLNLWTLYEHMGKHEMAIDQMRAALQVEPHSPDFHNNLGVSECFLKRYGEARVEFEQAYRLNPSHADYLVNLATIYQWEGQTDKALAWYRQGIKRNPLEPVFYVRMADLYLAQGSKVKALERLNMAWGLVPRNPKLIKQMGEDFQMAGQHGMAEQCLYRAQLAEHLNASPGSSPTPVGLNR